MQPALKRNQKPLVIFKTLSMLYGVIAVRVFCRLERMSFALLEKMNRDLIRQIEK